MYVLSFPYATLVHLAAQTRIKFTSCSGIRGNSKLLTGDASLWVLFGLTTNSPRSSQSLIYPTTIFSRKKRRHEERFEGKKGGGKGWHRNLGENREIKTIENSGNWKTKFRRESWTRFTLLETKLYLLTEILFEGKE